MDKLNGLIIVEIEFTKNDYTKHTITEIIKDFLLS